MKLLQVLWVLSEQQSDLNKIERVSEEGRKACCPRRNGRVSLIELAYCLGKHVNERLCLRLVLVSKLFAVT